AARSSAPSCNRAFIAPRNLKAPTRWKFSHLSRTVPPVRASSVRDRSTGVSWTQGRRRSAARPTSSPPMAGGGGSISMATGVLLGSRIQVGTTYVDSVRVLLAVAVKGRACGRWRDLANRTGLDLGLDLGDGLL